MDCIHLAQDMENCRAVVNTVMNNKVLQGIYSVAEELLVSQEDMCSMHLGVFCKQVDVLNYLTYFDGCLTSVIDVRFSFLTKIKSQSGRTFCLR
jgi:hypothetical protein